VTGRPGSGAARAVCRHAGDLFLFPFFEGGVLLNGHEQPGSVLRSPLDRTRTMSMLGQMP